MLGFGILLGFSLLGLILHEALHLPLPSNVIGLILFIIALFLKWIKLEWVEQSAQFLLKHLLLFFAPFIIGTIVFFPFIGSHFVMIAVSLIGSALVTLLVTGWVTALLTGKEADTHES